MDPKLLQILRAMLGVDNTLLPDSMTPEQFGKFIEEQKGKLFGNPEDIKNLQKIISQKDAEAKKVAADLEKLKKVEVKKNPKETKLEKSHKALLEKFAGVEKQLKQINLVKERGELEKQYPDIMPDLLIGKDEEKQKAVVEKQRALNKKLYGDARHFTQPKYEDAEQIQKDIDEVKADKSTGGEKSAVKVLQLIREKENFQPES